MRIALISEHASPLAVAGGVDAGGQNIYVLHVARQLARRGHAVDVYTRRDAPDLPWRVDLAPNLRVLHVAAGPARPIPKEKLLRYMPAFSREVARVALTRGLYDISHANFFMSGIASAALRREFGIPFAITFHALGRVRQLHQGGNDAFPPERNQIEDMLVRFADRVIAECPQDVADLERLYGAERSRMSCIPCGFDRREFGPQDRREARRAQGLPVRELVVLQLGRLVPRKGIDNVIEALGLLRPRLTQPMRLLVVGGNSDTPDEAQTPEIARLRTVAREAGVADIVHFTGRRRREELRQYYNAADVFVTTPWYEPFGITPLEAMACGTPVIGSSVGGIQETVVDGVTGLLVPPRDPTALAAALQQLAEAPEYARALGRAGMARVRRFYSWERVATELEAVYESIISQENALEQTAQSQPAHESAEVVS